MPAIDEIDDPTRTPVLRRVRSAVLLVLLAGVLGLGLAAVIGVTGVLVVSLLDHAIG